MAGVIPDVRLIVLLRNPVDRAYSHYRHVTRGGREKRGFEEIIDAEPAWLAKHAGLPENPVSNSGRNGSPGLLSRGIYVDQLARWRRFFDEGQMLVIKSEDFYARQAKTLKQVQGFLGLPSHEIATRSRTSRVHYEPMDQALRNRLEAFFEPHNSRLYDYLGRDFGW
jgi:hypothetical protein